MDGNRRGALFRFESPDADCTCLSRRSTPQEPTGIGVCRRDRTGGARAPDTSARSEAAHSRRVRTWDSRRGSIAIERTDATPPWPAVVVQGGVGERIRRRVAQFARKIPVNRLLAIILGREPRHGQRGGARCRQSLPSASPRRAGRQDDVRVLFPSYLGTPQAASARRINRRVTRA